MSFYRTILATLAAVALASPVFADDTTATTGTDAATMTTPSSTDTTSTTTTNASTTTTGSDQSTMSASTEGSKINVNKASAKELMKVKGLNASKARAIVAYRKKHGDFKSIEDLTNVKGFKKMKPDAMKEMEDQLTID